MSQKKYEVITLLSSDEETPPLVNSLLNRKTDVKTKKTARKSTATNINQLSIIPIKPEPGELPSLRTTRQSKGQGSTYQGRPNVSQPILNNTSMRQSTLSPKKPISNPNVCQPKLNNSSMNQSTLSPKKPISNNINGLNHISNKVNSVINLAKNTLKPTVNGFPPVEIAKKMPHLTITPVPKPSCPSPPTSRTARKSINSKSSRNSSPEVQIMATKLNTSSTYQNSAKFSQKNQPVTISSSSIKTAVQTSNSNKVNRSISSSYSNASNYPRKASGKSIKTMEDSLYVESLKKKARKSFPVSNSQLPPSLISTLGNNGVIITNVNNSNSLNKQIEKKREELFDPKSIKTSPDLSITKITSDEVSIISDDKVHEKRTQVAQTSMTQNSVGQQNSNSFMNIKSHTSSIATSKAKDTSTSKFDSHKNSETPFRKVSTDSAQSLPASRNRRTIIANQPNTSRLTHNDFSPKNNSAKPLTRAQRNRITSDYSNCKNSIFIDTIVPDSESDVIILPDLEQALAPNQMPVKPTYPLKPTLSKTYPSRNKQNVPVTDKLKKSQPLKRKNSNTISNPKSSKKVSFEIPSNGLSQNLALKDQHKRITAIKESLKDLNNDLKQHEKTSKSLDDIVKDSIISLPSNQEKKKDTIIPLPYNEEKKKNTIIPLPFVKKKKKNAIALSRNVGKKKDTIIPLPFTEGKKDTVIILPHVEEKKKNAIIPELNVEEKKKDTIIPFTIVEEKKKATVIPSTLVEEKKDAVSPSTLVEEKKKDAVIPSTLVREKEKDAVRPSTIVEEKEKDAVIPSTLVEEKKTDTVITSPHADKEEEESTSSLLQVEEKDINIFLQQVDESIKEVEEMKDKQHEMNMDVPNLEENSNEASVDAKPEQIINDASPKRPHKQVTSPKLSLKRKTNTDDTPVKRLKVSSDADSENFFVPLHNPDEPVTPSNDTVKSTDVISFPWNEDDDIFAKYKKFLQFSKPFMKSSPQEENKIVKTFLKQYQKADVQFIESSDFFELLRKTICKIKTNPGDTFVHLSAVSSRLKEHKAVSFSSHQSSKPFISSDRSKSSNHVKQISSDEPEATSHFSGDKHKLKATDHVNHLDSIARKDSDKPSSLSSNESKDTNSADYTEENSLFNKEKLKATDHEKLDSIAKKDSETLPHSLSNESKDTNSADCIEENSLFETETILNEVLHKLIVNEDSLVVDSANHIEQTLNDEPEIASDLSNSNELENSNINKHIEKIVEDKPQIISDSTNLNDISKNIERTNLTEEIADDEPEILSNFAEPEKEDYSPSLIAQNATESIEPNDSRSSPTKFYPVVTETSTIGLSMDDFYSRPSTSQMADFADMLMSSTIPGNTVAEKERESYKVPLDDLTRDSIEKYQEYLISKKAINSIPDSELPVPSKNPIKRVAQLEKGNDSDSTASFPDKSKKSDLKNELVKKQPRTDEERLELRIKWLEDYLAKLSKKIKKLQTKELSLDDLDDEESAYVLEDRYKRKFNKVYSKLCKLRKASSRLGREIERRFTYEGSRYEVINKAVEKLVNKRKAAEKFPDYKEILEKVTESNKIHQLCIDNEEELAVSIFKDVGQELKRRRILDVEQDLISYCPEDVELDYDPADHDESLKAKLISSAAEGEKKIQEIMQKFVEMQYVEKEKDKDDDGVMEVEETSDEEKEDSEIPETEPGTPSTDERMDEVEPETKLPEEELPRPRSYNDDPDIIDIGSSSDASTVPGSSALESKVSGARPNLLNAQPYNIIDDIEVIEESNNYPRCDSSPDLPSLEDIFK